MAAKENLWSRTKEWYERNFTLRGLGTLLFWLFITIPDWQYYIEYWKEDLPSVLRFIVTPLGRLVITLIAAAVIWLDNRSVLRRRGVAHVGCNIPVPLLRVADKGFYADFRTLSVECAPRVFKPMASLSCLHVRFKNDPQHSSQTCIAQILAEIEYYDSTNSLLCSIRGRWGDTTEPPRLPLGQTPEDNLTNVVIQIGQVRELDIAFKYQDESACYAMSNEVYGLPDWKHPTHKLPQGSIRARVRLRGVGVDASWDLRFENPSAGQLKPIRWNEAHLSKRLETDSPSNVPAIAVEIRELQVRADPFTAKVTDGTVCCSCDVFARVYLVNTVDVPTTVKNARIHIVTPKKEYHGQLLSMGDAYQIIKDVKGFRGALAVILNPRERLSDLSADFNSQMFVRAYGREGWLRFRVEDAVAGDLETGSAGIVILDALGGEHIGKGIGPWQTSGTVMKARDPLAS